MDGLATQLRPVGGDRYRQVELLVTNFGTIVITPETAAEIELEIPGWREVRDRRTKKYKKLRAFERDIEVIAEAEWIAGSELTEL